MSVPFVFARIPRVMFAAHRDGELTLTEFRVLLDLWSRRNRDDVIVRVRDLESLALSMRWDGETGTLSKALRSVRAKGWIEYESRPGRTHHPYDIRLLLPARSEHDPSSQTVNHAESDETAEPADPSRGLLDPSSDETSNPHPNGDSEAADADSVRAALELSRRTTSLSEEDAGPARAHASDPDEEALMDEIWASTAESARGAYWEPNG